MRIMILAIMASVLVLSLVSLWLSVILIGVLLSPVMLRSRGSADRRQLRIHRGWSLPLHQREQDRQGEVGML